MKKNFFSPAIIFILGFLTLGLGNNASIYIISDRLITDGEGSPLYPMREAVLNIITTISCVVNTLFAQNDV